MGSIEHLAHAELILSNTTSTSFNQIPKEWPKK